MGGALAVAVWEGVVVVSSFTPGGPAVGAVGSARVVGLITIGGAGCCLKMLTSSVRAASCLAISCNCCRRRRFSVDVGSVPFAPASSVDDRVRAISSTYKGIQSILD